MTDCLHMLYALNTVGMFDKIQLTCLMYSDVNLYLFCFYDLMSNIHELCGDLDFNHS